MSDVNFSDIDTWYVADYAKTDRSTCKEFRCKEKIEKGELRVGIEMEESDHFGSQLGWYHPACLHRTFTYKAHANKPIADPAAEVKGFDELKPKDQALFEGLAAGYAAKKSQTPSSQAAAAGASSTPSKNARDEAAAADPKLPHSLNGAQKAVVNAVIVTTLKLTNTQFAHKDTYKKHQGRWNKEEKAWEYSSDAQINGVLSDLGITDVKKALSVCSSCATGATTGTTLGGTKAEFGNTALRVARVLRFGGATYEVKDKFRGVGAKWNPTDKCWEVAAPGIEMALAKLGVKGLGSVDDHPLLSGAAPVPLTSLESAASSSGGEAAPASSSDGGDADRSAKKRRK